MIPPEEIIKHVVFIEENNIYYDNDFDNNILNIHSNSIPHTQVVDNDPDLIIAEAPSLPIVTSRLALLISPNSATIPSTLHLTSVGAITCEDTMLDTGNVEYNVMNDVLANIVNKLGIPTKQISDITLIGFENNSMITNQLITIPKFRLQFPEGNKTFANVDFLVIPANGITTSEIIISNSFLKEECRYDIVNELATHIQTLLGFDSDPEELPINNTATDQMSDTNFEELVFTSDEVDQLCDDDGTDPSDIAEYLSKAMCKTIIGDRNPCKSGLSGSVKALPTPIAKRQVTILIGDNDNVGIQLNKTNLVVNTAGCQYNIELDTSDGIHNTTFSTLPLHETYGLETIAKQSTSPKVGVEYSAPLKASLTTEQQSPALSQQCRKETNRNGTCPEITTVNQSLDALSVDAAAQSEVIKKRYYLPVEVSPPCTTPVMDGKYYLPKEVVHSESYSHSSKIQSPLAEAEAMALADISLDITSELSKEQVAAYSRRLLIRKAKMYSLAAKWQVSRDQAKRIAEQLNVNVSTSKLLAMPSVQEYLNKYKANTSADEHDNTIKANPKAFDFAQPETEVEVTEFINLRLQEAQENCSHTPEQHEPLVRLIHAKREALRIRLGRDHAAKVEPLRLQLKEGADPKKLRNHNMHPSARDQMNAQVDQLEQIKLVYRNKSARWCAPARMVPKPGGALGEMRMIIDYRYLNSLTIPVQGPMPILENEVMKCQGAQYFMTFDFLKGFYQIPIHEDSQHYFSFMTDKGVFTPTRIPQGAVDSPLYFHSCLSEIFTDLIQENKMLLWIDDGVVFAKDWKEFLTLIERVLDRCIEYNLKVNIKKTCLADVKTLWCGRIIDGVGCKLSARNTETFLNMSEPKVTGDLSQFLQGVSWMRKCLTNKSAKKSFAAISSRLWYKLEEAYARAGSRKKNRFKNILLTDLGWNQEDKDAFQNIKEMLADCQTNCFPIPGARMCLFTDASDLYYAAILTQVEHWDPDLKIHEQQHVPMATLSGEFKNSALNWRIMEKEAYPIIAALEEWEYLLLCAQGFDVYGDHNNIVKLFDPEKVSPPLHKAAVFRIYNWLYLLGQFKVNNMCHIPGEHNVWSDMCSRWANPAKDRPSTTRICVQRKTATKTVNRKRKKSHIYDELQIRQAFLRLKYNHSNPTTEMPSLALIKTAQAHLSPSEQKFKLENVKHITTDTNGITLFKNKMWIPHDHTELLTRICIGAHCGIEPGHTEPGHRSGKVTLGYIREYFYFSNMDEFISKFLHNCLCCIKDKQSNDIVPRMLGTSKHATYRGQILTFDYLYIGKLEKTSSHKFQYILVLKDEYSGFVELVPCHSPNSTEAADAISWWIARFCKPEWFVSDQGTHFKCKILTQLAKYFDCKHHFTLAYCPWSNGTVERANRDIKALLKIIGRETKLSIAKEWPYLLPAVMSILNNTPSERLDGLAPKQVYMGLPQYNPFTVLYSPHISEVKDVPLDKEEVSRKFNELRAHLDELHKRVDVSKAKRQDANQKASVTYNVKQRRASELGIRVADLKIADLLPQFAIGDFVMMAVPKTTKQHKLVGVWRGPYRVISTISDYIYEVEHLTTGKITSSHISRLKFYSDKELDTTIPELLNELNQEEDIFATYTVQSILKHKYDQEKMEHLLYVQWQGFSEDENTWESLVELNEQIPEAVLHFVQQLPKNDIKQELLSIVTNK